MSASLTAVMAQVPAALDPLLQQASATERVLWSLVVWCEGDVRLVTNVPIDVSNALLRMAVDSDQEPFELPVSGLQ